MVMGQIIQMQTRFGDELILVDMAQGFGHSLRVEVRAL